VVIMCLPCPFPSNFVVVDDCVEGLEVVIEGVRGGYRGFRGGYRGV